jgi:hypothetical protein
LTVPLRVCDNSQNSTQYDRLNMTPWAPFGAH